MGTYLSLDIGTTGTEVTLVSTTGTAIADAYTEYPIDDPQPGFAEQNSDL